MPIAIVGLPWMALGLEYSMAFARRIRFSDRGELSPRANRLLAGGLVALAVLCSLFDGPMPAAAYMRKHAALGTLDLQHAGPDPALAGNLDHLALDTFYSQGHLVGIFWPRRLPAGADARGTYRAEGGCRRALERRKHCQRICGDH